MNVIIQVLLGLTDLTAIVGFWRIKKLTKGILIALSSDAFIFVPLLAGSINPDISMEITVALTMMGIIMMFGWRMIWLYLWTKEYNEVQNLNTDKEKES